MAEIFVLLGAVGFFGAFRGHWSYGLAPVFWWASVFAATDDPIIGYGWLSMMVLEIMTRNDFPHLRQIITMPGRFIGSLIRSVIFNKGNRFQRLKQYESWAWVYDDYQSQVARARSDRKEKYIANVISQVIGVMLALYVGWLAYHMLPNAFQWFAQWNRWIEFGRANSNSLFNRELLFFVSKDPCTAYGCLSFCGRGKPCLHLHVRSVVSVRI